jgi:hypothetical protein
MATSPLWPKPPRWPIQPGAVDPNQRWVWHRRPRFILPLWEHAGAGAAQRFVRLPQTQDGKDVAAEHRRRGHTHALRARCQHSHGQRRRDRGACRQQSQLRGWEQNEPYTIALLIKGRSGGRNQAPVQVGELEHRRSHSLAFVRHTTPNLRHQASGWWDPPSPRPSRS